MPGFDGTGPFGQGPMTGGARGFCAVPASRAIPRSFGRRFFCRGGGRGFRHRYWATGFPGWYGYPVFSGWVDPALYLYGQKITPQQEADILKNEAKVLKEQLENIQSRIVILEKAHTEKNK